MEKELAVIYRSRNNAAVIEYNNILMKLFDEVISIKLYFADEISEKEKIYADACLVAGEDLRVCLRNNFLNPAKVIVLKNSLKKESLLEIFKIPKHEDVLVASDSYDDEIDIIYMMCEMGFRKYNYVPYHKYYENEQILKPVDYAVISNNVVTDCVEIPHIINLGFREISADTLLSLLDIFDVECDCAKQNIDRYTSKLVDRHNGPNNIYLDNYLKSYMVKCLADNSTNAIILLDVQLRVLYCNRKAEGIFNVRMNEIFSGISEKLLKNETDCEGCIVEINEEYYFYDKVKVDLQGATLGYVLIFSDRDSIITKNTIIDSEREVHRNCSFENIICESEKMQSCVEIAMKSALTENTVCIIGENGTGKTFIANAIHNFSKRKGKPFIVVDCETISDEIAESELLGYEKGILNNKGEKDGTGYFEQANGGTLYLKGIENISEKFQLILLKTLQEMKVVRLGGYMPVELDIRIVASAESTLKMRVEEGSFRRDLYYRINAIPIYVPALRNRKEDILMLMEQFMGKSYAYITESDKTALSSYIWPGNINELQSIAEYYKVFRMLPEYLVVHKASMAEYDDGNTDCIGLKKVNLTYEILKTICEETHNTSGIGRLALIELLHNKHIDIGDTKLRGILVRLKEQGYIVVSRGKTGMKISEAGKKYIEKINEIK